MLCRLLSQLKDKTTPLVISMLPPGPVGKLISDLGIEVRSLKLTNNPISLVRGFWTLLSLIREYRPSVVHTWMYHSDLVGGLAAKLCGVPRVIWCVRHANISLALNKPRTVLVAKICAWLSSYLPYKIVFASRKAQSIHENFGYNSSKSLTIFNGFDLNKFRPATPEERAMFRKKLNIPDNYKLVGLVARFDPVKNHEGFIEMASYLTKMKENVHFLMVGRGVTQSNDYLIRLINEYGLIGRFTLLGERDDMPEILRCLDALCLTSYSESFPNVLAEAMASGTPCVSTDVGDAKEILGDFGFTVPINKMDLLSRKVVEIIERASKDQDQLPEGARASIVERFELKEISRRYIALYYD